MTGMRVTDEVALVEAGQSQGVSRRLRTGWARARICNASFSSTENATASVCPVSSLTLPLSPAHRLVDGKSVGGVPVVEPVARAAHNHRPCVGCSAAAGGKGAAAGGSQQQAGSKEQAQPPGRHHIAGAPGGKLDSGGGGSGGGSKASEGRSGALYTVVFLL